jgi:radical SAM superfamily enzyme YgiQ (UPF0313 family)
LVQIAGVPAAECSEPKKGLLVAPEFPASFWSYRHIMRMVGRKAAFPPLGLITFAAMMPDNWSFELIDLNVERISDAELRERIDAADAVFTSAMSVQKPSLVELVSGPSKGLETPWVIGGPYPSSFRDHLLEPQTPSDEILHRGFDVLVWGEGGQWIETINRILHHTEGRRHSDGRPVLLIPEAVASQPPGSRKILNDRTIFKELEYTPPPRWDLLDIRDYRALMMQTTVGCRFRCDFCDIIQFNGGFTRPKTLESVREELEILFGLGYRGGIFTVDDNFVGNPQAIEVILCEMIEFQREHDYPFSFYTQASLDLGAPKLAHLLPLMQQAGFGEVFLGIENPDPAALKGMNKKQNVKVDIGRTVAKIQRAGIEVMAGFIFGGDEDTIETGEAIASFAKEAAIPTAMAGMLTPIPHTPLTERLRSEGRLREAEFSGNNTNDDVQFIPMNMTAEEMQTGYYRMLETLFSPGEMYQRAALLLDRINPHIFRGGFVRRSDLKAAAHSIWRQGIVNKRRGRYFGLLWKAIRLDRARFREAGRAATEMDRQLRTLGDKAHASSTDNDFESLKALIDRAHEAVIRSEPGRKLDEVSEWVARLREQIESRSPTADEVRSLYRWSREHSLHHRRVHRFPGAYLVKAFELAIKGLHYEMVMQRISRKDRLPSV